VILADVDLGGVVPLGGLTASGVLLLLVLFIARGALVPRKTVDALLASRDAEIQRAIARGDEYHAAYETERHALEVVRAQNGELIEVSRTVEHVMVTLREMAENRRSPDVAT
jgi:hypothetical protein